ncbi:MAG: hypothetical protein U9N52_10870 [Campylobacterota bacterium]|nr:hypothetical protein [Campylobacterota bacterium]
MAIDNSLYDALEETYIKIKTYLDTNQLGPEHSQMIVKHEALAELLETLDIEAIEEQSTDIHALHAKLNEIKEVSYKIMEDLNDVSDSIAMTGNVASGLDQVFSKITKIKK